MQFYDWLTAAKEWALSWFSDANRARFVALLNKASAYVDLAIPIVKRIDEELKPLLKDKEVPALVAIQRFLDANGKGIKNSLEIAQRLASLPMADMLANIALELLKNSSPASTSLSILKLSVEVAYNIYKAMK